jgi:hypothetical protein
LVIGPQLALRQVLSILNSFVRHLAPAPGGVTYVVGATHLDIQLPQEAIVPHPVVGYL